MNTFKQIHLSYCPLLLNAEPAYVLEIYRFIGFKIFLYWIFDTRYCRAFYEELNIHLMAQISA